MNGAIRIERGHPDDAECAALVLALSLPVRRRAPVRRPPRRGRYGGSWQGAWRASGLPA
ncbi:acyl-CoA carboxylase epsilon subunit [Amycolatopsis sp. NPDC098790]|uniref:acyl-CoA carboxylase epsilon subunit n=1 Tax=Amycolatopsis sp. NPDC098790 TaxID=3363939 RepID=UPI003822E08E